ncbi:hypothetical protein L1049_023924 [Liquidambar formosana]|uniref:Uncharacterized protein n=1 Tax=Liquidambar formosana TaxID=63359 RepID=A0AAP0RZV4_LIQFO
MRFSAGWSCLKDYYASMWWKLWIAEFRGSLSVFTLPWVRMPCSIWVMREYGIAESWSKQFTIDLEGGVGKIISLRKNDEVLVATKNGELVSYHPETHQIMHLAIRSTHEPFSTQDSFYLGAYVESLVLLKKVNGVLRMENESCGLVTHKGALVLPRNEESENCGLRKKEKTGEE